MMLQQNEKNPLDGGFHFRLEAAYSILHVAEDLYLHAYMELCIL